ncbi:stage V sporulation protein AA [Virgibacillus kimchii]
MPEIVYLRMKKKLVLSERIHVHLKDIAYISTNTGKQKQKLENTPIYRITKKDKNTVIIDSFLIIDYLNETYEDMEFQLIGPEQTLISIQTEAKSPSILLTACAWIILFIGAAMTIMNFHYDVSMQQVQQQLHLILTGEENEFPLWIQIPYSFGLGLGMILFFNHWFNKRINEEPSPLEVEIFNYQQNLDQYVKYHENKIK